MEISGKYIANSNYAKKKNIEKEELLLTDINHLNKTYRDNVQVINTKKRNWKISETIN